MAENRPTTLSAGHFRGRRAAMRLALLAPLALTACQVPSSINRNPVVTFQNVAPLQFDAAQVEFVDLYRPPLAPPNVEHLLQQTPASAARDWARARIAAVGPTGTVRVTVHDASIVEVKLPTRRGVAGLFYNEQEIRYDAALEVSIEYVGRAIGAGQARTRVIRTQTVPETLTVNERSQVFYTLLKGLTDDLDRELTASARRYLGQFIRN